LVKCNSLEIQAKKGDLVVINSNELHNGYCISESVEYYCIIFDTSLFQSRHIDTCETKYINPISQNRILFENKIESNKEIAKHILEFVKEYETKEIGYEMAVKATLYQILVLLLRNHVQLVLTSKEYDVRMRNLKRFNSVLEYIENNYNDKITIDQLCFMVNISRFYFCRLFKSITGKSMGEYLNQLRINKAESFLQNGDVNITEAAMSCGFDDINYFSRMFKKYKHESPSSILHKKAEIK
jgi:AraC-like DNA-binding protein